MVEFLVLGSLEPRESGELIRVRGMRQQRLLALLLVNANRVVPMGVLVDELWENPPSSARQQVHNAVRDLRRILPAVSDSVLITVDVGYRLAVPEDAIDTYRFTSGVRAAKAAEKNGRLAEAIQLLQSAVDLWRGDAFAGIQCPAVTGAAVRLNEQRLTAIEDLMAWRLKAGESSSLVGELQELIAEYPLRDSLRGSLMLALYRSGRQADALAVYDEARRHLADELGLEPGPHLRSLHMAILADAPVVQENAPKPSPEPGDGPVPATGASVVSAASSPGNHRNYLPHCPTDFTGRVTETRFLLSLAERGQGEHRRWLRSTAWVGWARQPWRCIPPTPSPRITRTGSTSSVFTASVRRGRPSHPSRPSAHCSRQAGSARTRFLAAWRNAVPCGGRSWRVSAAW